MQITLLPYFTESWTPPCTVPPFLGARFRIFPCKNYFSCKILLNSSNQDVEFGVLLEIHGNFVHQKESNCFRSGRDILGVQLSVKYGCHVLTGEHRLATLTPTSS